MKPSLIWKLSVTGQVSDLFLNVTDLHDALGSSPIHTRLGLRSELNQSFIFIPNERARVDGDEEKLP